MCRDRVIPHRQTCFHDWNEALSLVDQVLGLVVASMVFISLLRLPRLATRGPVLV